MKDKFIITSNRDEKLVRKMAITPVAYKHGKYYLIYPKDGDAGGSWMVMKENGDCAVLLNGAFLPHKVNPPYRRSRGLILLDIIDEESPSRSLVKINLDGIEPFTLVLLDSGSLYEFRWDGNERYCKQLTVHRPHIWSSTTLYDGLVIRKREQWFAEFLNQKPDPTQRDILNFHRFAGDGDNANDLLMSRENMYRTVSVTSIFLTSDRGSMKYIDLLTSKETDKNIALTQKEWQTHPIQQLNK